jgi:hypothetical protein
MSAKNSEEMHCALVDRGKSIKTAVLTYSKKEQTMPIFRSDRPIDLSFRWGKDPAEGDCLHLIPGDGDFSLCGMDNLEEIDATDSVDDEEVDICYECAECLVSMFGITIEDLDSIGRFIEESNESDEDNEGTPFGDGFI